MFWNLLTTNWQFFLKFCFVLGVGLLSLGGFPHRMLMFAILLLYCSENSLIVQRIVQTINVIFLFYSKFYFNSVYCVTSQSNIIFLTSYLMFFLLSVKPTLFYLTISMFYSYMFLNLLFPRYNQFFRQFCLQTFLLVAIFRIYDC